VQPDQSFQPVPPATTPSAKMTSRKKLGLWLVIAPTALLIAAAIIFVISGLVTPTAPASGTTLFNNPTPFASILNILGYLMNIIAFITWLPGLIIGIVLLATPKK